MKTKLISVNVSFFKVITAMWVLFILSGCTPIDYSVPQLPSSGSYNSAPVVGADITLANNFLNQGKRREAAEAYFAAAQNYRSPERERLILQAAELASLLNDPLLTQEYLAPVNFNSLDIENQTRFRLIQAQLALNDRNYRETLRILPQRVDNIPEELGQKVLKTRMSAAQGSGDKLSLVQELVLQERTLTEPHLVKLNHDRIWGHAQQIPAFQLAEAKDGFSHPIVKGWLSLAQLSRISKNGPANKRQTFRGDLGGWIQNNPNHAGMPMALGLLNAAPTTTVTPYSVNVPVRVVNKPAVKTIPVKKPVVKAPVVKAPVVKKPIVTKPIVTKEVKKDPSVGTLYEQLKKQINKQ